MRDSRMSDSQFMRFQQKAFERTKRFTTNVEKEIIRKRIDSKSKDDRKETLFKKFYRWINGR